MGNANKAARPSPSRRRAGNQDGPALATTTTKDAPSTTRKSRGGANRLPQPDKKRKLPPTTSAAQGEPARTSPARAAKRKAPVPAPSPSPKRVASGTTAEQAEGSADKSTTDEDDEGNSDADEEEELSRRQLLKGIDVSDSSEGEDSSEDEGASLPRVGSLGKHKTEGDKQDLFALGRDTIALDPSKEAEFTKKLQSVKDTNDTKCGVIYLGRIPSGFYEEQMRGYFSQFGEVTRLRLSRNKKTGHSKHYGFVEFRSEEVAKIVCETMHNYLLSGRLLQCKFVPSEAVHPHTFRGAGRRFRRTDRYAAARNKHNAEKTDEEIRRALRKDAAREKKNNQKLKKKGIRYKFEL